MWLREDRVHLAKSAYPKRVILSRFRLRDSPTLLIFSRLTPNCLLKFAPIQTPRLQVVPTANPHEV